MSNCNCAKVFKIPVLEKDFMNDQRSDRKVFIGNCDSTATLTSTTSLKCFYTSDIFGRFFSQNFGRESETMADRVIKSKGCDRFFRKIFS